MMIASTSSTFCAEATPAPSARTARSSRLRASGSPLSSARAHTPLVSRVRPRSSMILNSRVFSPRLARRRARASIEARPGVGLHAAAAAAAAQGAADADDHVADLTGRVAADPRLAVEHDAAADAGAPEHAEQRAVRAARAERELRVGRHLDVVAEQHRRAAAPSRARFRMLKLPPQPGRFLARRHRAGVVVHLARRADADALERRVSMPAWAAASLQRAGDLGRYAGRTAGRGRGPTRLARYLAALVDDDRLDLGASEIDSPGVSHAVGVPDRNVSCVTGSSRRGISVTVMASILTTTPVAAAIFRSAGAAGGGAQSPTATATRGRRAGDRGARGRQGRAARDPVADPVSVATSPRSAARRRARVVEPRAARPQREALAVDLPGGRCWSCRSSVASAIANRSPDRRRRASRAARRGGAPRSAFRPDGIGPGARRSGRPAPSPRGRLRPRSGTRRSPARRPSSSREPSSCSSPATIAPSTGRESRPLVDALDRDLLEHEAGDVLGPVDHPGRWAARA